MFFAHDSNIRNLRKVIEIHCHWRHSTANYALIVENKGSGMSLIQDLRGDDIYAIGVTPEGDKVMRMSAQTARIEAGSVLLPKQAPWLDEFRRELLAFPVAATMIRSTPFTGSQAGVFSAAASGRARLLQSNASTKCVS